MSPFTDMRAEINECIRIISLAEAERCPEARGDLLSDLREQLGLLTYDCGVAIRDCEKAAEKVGDRMAVYPMLALMTRPTRQIGDHNLNLGAR